MKLDDIQTARVREWIDQGLKVAEVQTKLSEEMGIGLTYMEARMLLDDLKLQPRDPTRPAVPAESVPTAESAPAVAPLLATPGSAVPVAGAGGKPAGTPGVAVTVDNVARPGTLASGKVTFRDGQIAEWQLDQFGRLGVAPRQAGYQPSRADVADFQAELETVLARLGY